MNIKKLVVGSMFSMLLGSEMAAADWDDVYYCQMTESIGVTRDGKMNNHPLEKFQFKLDQTSNAMVFGSTGYFADSVLELTTGSTWPSQETWRSNYTHSMTSFEEGTFVYTRNGFSVAALVISADCDKF